MKSLKVLLICITSFICLLFPAKVFAEEIEFTSNQIEIHRFARDICENYEHVTPELAIAVIQKESLYDPEATNGGCVGLMQVSKKYNKYRAEDLGVEDFFDPYGNILIGVDFLNELIDTYEDVNLALMLYNMKWDSAFNLYKQGKISSYAKDVQKKMDDISNLSEDVLYGEEVRYFNGKDEIFLQ